MLSLAYMSLGLHGGQGFLRIFSPYLALAVIGALAMVVPSASAGSHPPITVTRFDDPPPNACPPTDCSLREALILANSVLGPDTLILPAGTYQMNLGLCEWYEDSAYACDLDITDDLTVMGADADETVITATPGLPERGFDVLTDVVAVITDLSVRDLTGGFQPIDCGRGIRNRGDLTLERVVIENNQMRGSGGGVCNEGGTLTVRDSVFSRNCACLRGLGGGIYSAGLMVDGAFKGASVVLQRVTLSDNVAHAHQEGGGGAVYARGPFTATDSVVAGNQAGGPFGKRTGGGMDVGGTVTLVNVTATGNHTDGEDTGIGEIDSRGAGLAVGGDVTLTNVTLTGNDSETTAGGLFYRGGFVGGGGTLTLANTTIAGNTGGDCEGAITSAGHNIDGDGTCALSGPGDMAGVDPMLAPLADNGGPTQTHALLPGSPAIDAGDDAVCPEADQRGAPRPVDGDGSGGPACDIGAFEAGGIVPTPLPPTPTATPPPPVLTGDADCAGGVQATDALWVLRFSAAMQPYAECLFAANANCDLHVDAVDALLILRYVAALPVTQPPGCPKIGPPEVHR